MVTFLKSTLCGKYIYFYAWCKKSGEISEMSTWNSGLMSFFDSDGSVCLFMNNEWRFFSYGRTVCFVLAPALWSPFAKVIGRVRGIPLHELRIMIFCSWENMKTYLFCCIVPQYEKTCSRCRARQKICPPKIIFFLLALEILKACVTINMENVALN
jgi:hypothetical protein